MKPVAPRSQDPNNIGTIMEARKDDNGDGWVALTELAKANEAVPLREIQIKQNEREVWMLDDEAHRLSAICGLQDRDTVLQILKNCATLHGLRRIVDQ